jgi:flagellar motor protein MotB
VIRAGKRGGSENFYVSLNDMLVGVLFIFILLLAWSAADYNRRLTRSETFKAEQDRRVEERTKLLNGLQETLKARGYQASVRAGEGVLRFKEELLFEQGRHDLKPQGREALALMGQLLAGELACPPDRQPARPCDRILEAIYVEGHTDSTPVRGNPDGNFELSALRAIAAMRAMTARASALETLTNVRDERLIGVSGYADTRPLPDTRPSDAVNRRVDFRFVLEPPRVETPSGSSIEAP